MLDLVRRLVVGVERLQWHAVVTHALVSMSAECRVALAVNLAILRTPVFIDGVFLDNRGRILLRFFSWLA